MSGQSSGSFSRSSVNAGEAKVSPTIGGVRVTAFLNHQSGQALLDPMLHIYTLGVEGSHLFPVCYGPPEACRWYCVSK